MDIDLDAEPIGHGRRRQARLPAGHLADRSARSPTTVGKPSARDVPQGVRRGLRGRRALERAARPDGRPLRVGRRRRPTCKQPAVLRRHAGRARRRSSRDRRGAGAGRAGRQHHDRPHLAGRVDQGAGPGRQLPDRARRRPERLQLLRLAPGQPRGDGPRDVRQHPPAQPARPGHRGRRHPRTCPTARAMSIFDASEKYRERRRPARRPRRQGVRLGLVARLGGQGHRAAGRAGGDRRELRADPPLEPRRHGRPRRSSSPTATRRRRSA